MPISLCSSLDLDKLRKEFSVNGRLRVDNILDCDSAEQALQALTTDLPWHLVYRDGGETIELDGEQLQRLDPRQRSAMRQRIHAIAARQFQFFYFSCQLDDQGLAAIDASSPVHDLVSFLRGRPFIDCVEKITGVGDLVRVKTQASCYQGGHFLLPHDDGVGDTRRKIAYVLNLSKNWSSAWGGMLQFHDKDDNIMEAFLPAFNSLSLFRIPAIHSVSCVTPFANESRMAVSGWLYT